MSAPKATEPEPRSVPAPIVFGDEPTTNAELDAAYLEFSEDEHTVENERPDSWSGLRARRMRSMTGEAASD